MVSSSVYGLPDALLTKKQKRLSREPGKDSRSHSQPPPPPLPWLSLLVVTVLQFAPLPNNLPQTPLLCFSKWPQKRQI